ncbi:MAG: hypothetical protein Tsb005_14280 [Gammaproteobacteria bacterium]
MHTITQITQKELKLSGYTIIDCDINEGTTIIIKEGKLKVNGLVGKNVNINVSGKKNTVSIQGNNFNFNNTAINQLYTSSASITDEEDGSVIFNGPVEDNICVTATGDITCNDNIGNNNQLQTHNGNIYFKNSGNNCFFKAHNGKVTAQKKGENTILKTTNDNIDINNAEQKNLNKKNVSQKVKLASGNKYTIFYKNPINFLVEKLKKEKEVGKEKEFNSSSHSGTDRNSRDDNSYSFHDYTNYTGFY